MAYLLSATKLSSYRACPQAYYYKHEWGLKTPTAFGSPALGNALHKALAHFYQDWNYGQPIPPREWATICWEWSSDGLTDLQVNEGYSILQRYYDQFIAPAPQMAKPLGVEARINGTLTFENIEFALNGRYDRLDWVEDGLEIIDYKTTKTRSEPEAVDLQLGFYYLILEQRYHYALKRLRLIYLRSMEEVTYEVTDAHHRQVQHLIANLATQLRGEEAWCPHPSEECDRCSYQHYCPAQSTNPEPLPEVGRSPRRIQLTLAV
jgi:putative RecB family exonuclease